MTPIDVRWSIAVRCNHRKACCSDMPWRVITTALARSLSSRGVHPSWVSGCPTAGAASNERVAARVGMSHEPLPNGFDWLTFLVIIGS